MDNNMFSVENLVEFGMGVAVANQMVSSMNNVIKNTAVPGANNTVSNNTKTDVVYYAAIDEKAAGPFTVTELSRLIADKKINKNTLIWQPGMPEWKRAEEIPEVLKIVALTPPPLHNN